MAEIASTPQTMKPEHQRGVGSVILFSLGHGIPRCPLLLYCIRANLVIYMALSVFTQSHILQTTACCHQGNIFHTYLCYRETLFKQACHKMLA
jgi:hypothetical protein